MVSESRSSASALATTAIKSIAIDDLNAFDVEDIPRWETE